MFRILKKILNILLTLFGVVTIIFFLFNILPGDPAQMMLGQNENSEQLELIKKKYGFDKPVFNQYLYYLNDLSIISIHSKDPENISFLLENKYNSFNLFSTKNYNVEIKTPYLRESCQKNGLTVTEIIKNTLPNTIVLAVSSISIAIFLGLFLGIVSALYKNTWIDVSIQFFSTLGMSVPSFFSAIIFAWLFGYVLNEYTGLNMTGSLFELDDYGEQMTLRLQNLILPSLVLGIRPVAVISQMMRNSLLKVLKKKYITTAYAKGLSKIKVIQNHALKNSLNPVITALSGWFASMLAGSVFVEYIFGWNGLGKEIVDALNKLDVPVLIGSVLTISVIFIMINIFVDIIYKWLDPRIKIINKMRKKIVAGNWKMNNDLDQTIDLIKKLKSGIFKTEVDVMIAPSFPFLKVAFDLTENTNIEVISQNVNENNSGAFTGEVSVKMLKSIGLSTTLIGHSERRALYYENDDLLLKKINFALENEMNVIFCFGEELSDRKSGKYFEVIKNQLDNTIIKLKSNQLKNIVLAYEPVWAIGTGETATADQAQEMHSYVRSYISDRFNLEVAQNISILYGGSVKPNNALEIFSKADVDGGLIGGAALNSSDFLKIIEANT